MIPGSVRQRLIVALIGLTVITAFIYVGGRAGLGGFSQGDELSVVFDRILQGLDTSSEVKIRGVKVGSVRGIEVRDDGKVSIELLMRSQVRVADTTKATIESLSVFGPKFVNLIPGAHETSGPFLRPGATITNTTAPLDFLEVVSHGARLLEVVDPRELFTAIHALGEGLDGLGPELGRTVDAAEVIGRHASGQLGNLRSFLADAARLSETLADRGDELVSTARNLHGVLPEIASRPDQLGELLDQTSRLSAVVADIIEAHPDALGDTIVGVSNIVSALHSDIPGLVALIEGLDAFFAGVGGTVQVPGPKGTTIGANHAYTPATVCGLTLGAICNPGGEPIPAAAVTRTAAPRPARAAPRLAPAVISMLLPVHLDALIPGSAEGRPLEEPAA